MPKPTFFQAVLRKPTRSYANPHAPSPWAEQPERYDEDEEEYYESPRPSSRYAARVDDGVHLGFRETEAGPSRKARPPQSAVSFANTGISSASRFPKPAKKVNSAVVLRETVYLRDGEEEGEVAAPRRKKKGSKARSEAASSVGGWEREGPLSYEEEWVPKPKATKRVAKPADIDTRDSASSISASPGSIRPPRPRFAHNPSGSSSSAASSPGLPPSSPATSISTRQVAQALLHKQLPSRNAAPLTPPTSDTSHSTNGSLKKEYSAAVRTDAVALAPQAAASNIGAGPNRPSPIVTVTSGDEAVEDEEFFTPQQDVHPTREEEPTPDEGDSMEANTSANLTPRPLAPPLTYTPNAPRIAQPMFAPPVISFQPPTPAPIADPEESPFYSETDMPTSLRPSQSAPTPSSQAVSASMQTTETVDNADAKSVSGEDGSDDDEVSERMGDSRPGSRGRSSRQNSFNAPVPVASIPSRSRPSSVARSGGSPSLNGARSPSRHSVRSQKTSRTFDDFKVIRRGSAAASEASFWGRSVMEGSVRSGGYSKGGGGWAAAAASGSRPGSTVPTMYMPTTGHDGWADFHAPPPPRQSRFTPLPTASQPMTFDRLVNGDLEVPMSRQPSASSPSEYSQDTDESDDDLPKPSRSYANQNHDYEDNGGYDEGLDHEDEQGDFDEHDIETPRLRQGSMATYQGDDQEYASEDERETIPDRQWARSPGPPLAPRLGSIISAGPESVNYDSRPMSPYMQSRPTSPSNYYSQPNSPVIPRPGSRIGFETPSFLHPDTLTILPEMSNEDSDKTYQPAPAANPPPRRATSVFGGFARSVKSDHASQEDGDIVPELPGRRAKSAMGGSKWEGSSYGDGVLMESNGRASESVSGYTYADLILCVLY
jgi:hypothetical protein